MKRTAPIKREVVDIEIRATAGRVPPHDLDAEAAVISACMLADMGPDGLSSSSAFMTIADLLRPQMFFSEAHLRVWEAFEVLTVEKKPIDIVTVGAHLKETERLSQVGGLSYLSQILDTAPVIRNVRVYAQRIVDTWRLRRMMLMCQQYVVRAYGDVGESIPSYIASVGRELSKLGEGQVGERMIEIHPLLKESFDDIRSRYEQGRPAGICTGIRGLDSMTDGGLHRKELTIVAARPGVGKSSFMFSVALNIAEQPPLLVADDGGEWAEQGVGIFTLEMPRKQVGDRFIALESGVSCSKIRSGRVEENDWTPMMLACRKLQDFPIAVDDTTGLTLNGLRSKVQMLKARWAARPRKRKLAVVMVDYIQLMKHEDARTRIEEIGLISRGLKALAKDEDVAVVAGCQLNRAIETRTTSKRPILSDLRESGDLEQDADNVLGLFRGAYYGEKDPDGEEGRSEIGVLKQRSGPTGTVILRFTPPTTLFDNMPGHH